MSLLFSEPCPGPSDRVGSSASLPNEPNIKSCNHAGRQTNGDQQRRDEMRETYVVSPVFVYFYSILVI